MSMESKSDSHDKHVKIVLVIIAAVTILSILFITYPEALGAVPWKVGSPMQSGDTYKYYLCDRGTSVYHVGTRGCRQ